MKKISILIIQFILFTNLYIEKAFALAIPSQVTNFKNVIEVFLENKVKQTIKNTSSFIKFLIGAYNLRDIKKMSRLDKEWSKYSKWIIKITIINFLINLFFGITSFCLTFLVIYFISSGNISFGILVLWIIVISLNIIAKILFEKIKEILFQRPYYSLLELLNKEYNSYKNLKICKKKFNSFSSFTISSAIAFWQSSQNAMYDFWFGVLGGFIAVAIFNPIYLIPYSIILVISVIFIMICVYFQKNNYKGLDEEKRKLSEQNKIYSSLEKKMKIKQWNKKIKKAFNKYDKKRIFIDAMLRILIYGVIPLIGVVIFLFSNTSTVILLFYILSLNLFAVFGLVYYFKEGHKGIVAKKQMFELLNEITKNEIIINEYSWNKNKKSKKTGYDLIKNSEELFINNFSLKIKNKKQNILNIENKKIKIKKGHITMLTGDSGSGKTSIMQFLGAKLFLNKESKDDEYSFKGNGKIYVKVRLKPKSRLYSIFPLIGEGKVCVKLQVKQTLKNKEVEIIPDNISYENLQKLVCYYNFDDIENFNININLLNEKKKKEFIKYVEKMGIGKEKISNNGNLSQGERARIKLALILAYIEEKFILLDQPFVLLDSKSAKKVYDVLNEFAIEKKIGILIGQPDLNINCNNNYNNINLNEYAQELKKSA